MIEAPTEQKELESGNDSDLSSVSSRFNDSDTEVETSDIEERHQKSSVEEYLVEISTSKLGRPRGRPPKKIESSGFSTPNCMGSKASVKESKAITLSSGRRLTPQSVLKKDRAGRTILFRFVLSNDVTMAEKIIQTFSVDVNIRDNAGWTPLHEASLGGLTEMVHLLLKYGADVNIQANNQDSPLHDAVENKHVNVVKLLLNNGANPLMKNAESKTPLDVCSSSRVADLLHKAVKKLKKKKEIGTPLYSSQKESKKTFLKTSMSSQCDSSMMITEEGTPRRLSIRVKTNSKAYPSCDSTPEGDWESPKTSTPDATTPLSREERKLQYILRMFEKLDQGQSLRGKEHLVSRRGRRRKMAKQPYPDLHSSSADEEFSKKNQSTVFGHFNHKGISLKEGKIISNSEPLKNAIQQEACHSSSSETMTKNIQVAVRGLFENGKECKDVNVDDEFTDQPLSASSTSLSTPNATSKTGRKRGRPPKKRKNGVIHSESTTTATPSSTVETTPQPTLEPLSFSISTLPLDTSTPSFPSTEDPPSPSISDKASRVASVSIHTLPSSPYSDSSKHQPPLSPAPPLNCNMESSPSSSFSFRRDKSPESSLDAPPMSLQSCTKQDISANSIRYYDLPPFFKGMTSGLPPKYAHKLQTKTYYKMKALEHPSLTSGPIFLSPPCSEQRDYEEV